MRTLRVLMLADVFFPDTVGGAGRYLYDLARELVGKGHEVAVVTRQLTSAQPLEEQIQGIQVRRFPVNTDGSLAFFATSLWHGAQLLRRLGGAWDLLHIHQPLAGCSALLVGWWKEVPWIYTFHGPWHLEYRIKRELEGRLPVREHLQISAMLALEDRLLRRCRAVTALSDFSLSQVRQFHPAVAERLHRIPGAVDMVRFRLNGQAGRIRKKLGVQEGDRLLLSVRNLVPRMGLERLLEAFKYLVGWDPSYVLALGGSGPLEGRLRQLARHLGVESRVRWLGRIPEEELAEYYREADLFVLPTRHLEGFGLVTVEALACGTPVMGTPVGATPEILERVNPEWIFLDSTAIGMARQIHEYFQRGEKPARAWLRHLVEQSYSTRAVAGQFEELYGQMVAP